MPWPGCTVLTGHATQAVAPKADANLPAGQRLQLLEPVLAAYVPTKQRLHTELPAKAENVPALQGVQLPDLAALIQPAGHDVQVSFPLPLAYWPCIQAPQEVAPTARLAVAEAQRLHVPPMIGL